LEEGCPKLKEYDLFSPVYDCMCTDWDATQKVRHEAELRAAKNAAFKQAVKSSIISRIPTEGSLNFKEGSASTKNKVNVAEEVAKELLWMHMKSRGDFDQLVSESVNSHPQEAQMISKAETEKALMLENCLRDPDCLSKPSFKEAGFVADIFDKKRLDECLSTVDSPNLSADIRKSYEEGSASSVCALLQLSSSSLRSSHKSLYQCLCKVEKTV
jgi:hypothetical protein